MTVREADIFRCVADTVVAPDAVGIRSTDAVGFFSDWLARSPRPNRAALRGFLYALDRAPLASGRGARLRRLPAPERRAALDRLRRTPLAGAVKAVASIAQLAYYGDEAVMRSLGYDAGAVVDRCRDLRSREARW
jgi:hypothetical protein